MPQIHVRIPPNIHAALSAFVRERELEGGLSDLCGQLITRFVLDGFEFSQLDALTNKIHKLSDSVARVEARPIAGGLTEEQDQHLRANTNALVKIIKLLESAGGLK